MKYNSELQIDVQYSSKWEQLLNAVKMGITTKDGVVSLTDLVANYVKILEAENDAKKVPRLKARFQKIEVQFPRSWTKTNTDITHDVESALKSNWSLPIDKITAKVKDGWVTLEGELPWNYQKQDAENAVNSLEGVTGVTNNIEIISESYDAIEKNDAEVTME